MAFYGVETAGEDREVGSNGVGTRSGASAGGANGVGVAVFGSLRSKSFKFFQNLVHSL